MINLRALVLLAGISSLCVQAATTVDNTAIAAEDQQGADCGEPTIYHLYEKKT